MRFSEAKTVDDMVRLLEDMATQMKNTTNGNIKYVYHYTNAAAAIAILTGKRWFIGSPKKMNDGLELLHLEDAHYSNLFFASFLSDNSESIAMWAMYSQPWSDGVIIKIPVEKLKHWLKENPCIYAANDKSKTVISAIEGAKISLHYVAYTNEESQTDINQIVLTCGDQTNQTINRVLDNPNVSGYIKDSAWSYEKELRLRITVNSLTEYNAVMIDIPKDVLDSFEFITGPKYNGNLLAQIRKGADQRFDGKRISQSLFTGRLNWTYCDYCQASKEHK